MADQLFDPWCSGEQIGSGSKILHLLCARTSGQRKAIEVLQSVVPTHYCKPEVVRKWLKRWGYEKTLAVVRKDLPSSKKARSGDLGEILATEYVNRRLDFNVPIFPLRWRDHRELTSAHHDDYAEVWTGRLAESLEAGTMDRSAVILIHAGLRSRIAALAALNDCPGDFTGYEGMKHWLRSNPVVDAGRTDG